MEGGRDERKEGRKGRGKGREGGGKGDLLQGLRGEIDVPDVSNEDTVVVTNMET